MRHFARLLAAGARTLAQLFQGTHPAFVPSPPGLDAGADPNLFLGQLLVELGPLAGFRLERRLFSLQVSLIVARPAR